MNLGNTERPRYFIFINIFLIVDLIIQDLFNAGRSGLFHQILSVDAFLVLGRQVDDCIDVRVLHLVNISRSEWV